MREVAVAGIFAPCLTKSCEIAFNFVASNRQQRTNQAFFPLPGRNPGKSARASTTYNPHQNSLGLIVERVGGSDLRCLAIANQTREPLVTQFTRRGLQAEFVFLRISRRVGRT